MMPDRLRLFRVSTALLYVGPLLAGLMGQGWAMVLAFVVVFLLWSVIVRAHLWPMTLADLGRSEAAVALASLVATQAVLVIVCFAVGRGIGGVLALKPALPAVLPLALSVLSVPLSRLLSGPHGMVETAGFDPVWRDVTPARAGSQARERAMMPELLAAEMLAPILALGDEPELVPDCPPAALVAQAARDCGDTVTASEMIRLAGLLG